MPDQYDAVVAGHICLDIYPDLSASTADQFRSGFAPGRLFQVGPAALSTGGAVSNTGLALNRLGVATRLMGKIGDDLFGQAVLSIVQRHGPGLAGGMVVDASSPTSYTVVVSPPDIDRMFLHCPGANDTFGADDVRYDLLAAARLFHFGYPPLMRRMFENGGAELAALFCRAKETGVTTSLDMALPDPNAPAGRADWVTILAAALPYVDIFLPSIEEILYMLRRPTFEELRRAAGSPDILPLVTPALLSDLSGQLLDMGVKIAGLKLGSRGFYLRTGDREALAALGRGRPADPAAWAGRELWSACFRANLVGTAGSGDATIAGFLAALLNGRSPHQALTTAVAVGGCNVEAADTLSGVRTWDETMARVAAGWERYPMTVDAPGWAYDAEAGLWAAA